MWGFPLPWTWWPGVSSLEWHLAIPAVVVDLAVYSLPVALAGRLLQPRVNALPKIGIYLSGGLLALVALCLLIPWLVFWPTYGLAVPLENVTTVSWCVFSNCYATN